MLKGERQNRVGSRECTAAELDTPGFELSLFATGISMHISKCLSLSFYNAYNESVPRPDRFWVKIP